MRRGRLIAAALAALAWGTAAAGQTFEPLFGRTGPSLTHDFTLGNAVPAGYTFTRTSTDTANLYSDAAGASLLSFAGSAPVIVAGRGILLQNAATNFLLHSTAPANQTTGSLSTGTYVLWCIGTGSLTSSAGTATATGLGAIACSSGTWQTIAVTVAGTVTVNVTGTVTMEQLENSAAPTSLLVTAAATLARSATTLTYPIGPWFNPVAGTWVVKATYAAVPPVAAQVLLAIDDGTNNNRFVISATNSSTTPLNGGIIVGGVSQGVNPPGAVLANGQAVTFVLSYGYGQGLSAQNGGQAFVGSSPAAPILIPTGITTLRPGSASVTTTRCNCWIRSVQYFPRLMTPGEARTRSLQ